LKGKNNFKVQCSAAAKQFIGYHINVSDKRAMCSIYRVASKKLATSEFSFNRYDNQLTKLDFVIKF